MTTSSSTTSISEKESPSPDNCAPRATGDSLAKVVSAYQESETVFAGIATDLLALSVELVTCLQLMEARAPAIKPVSLRATSRLHRSIRQLLSFWPQHSDSQERLLTLLASGGLEKMVDITPEGLPSLSTDQILDNVVRAIEVSRARNQKQSSSSAARTT